MHPSLFPCSAFGVCPFKESSIAWNATYVSLDVRWSERCCLTVLQNDPCPRVQWQVLMTAVSICCHTQIFQLVGESMQAGSHPNLLLKPNSRHFFFLCFESNREELQITIIFAFLFTVPHRWDLWHSYKKWRAINQFSSVLILPHAHYWLYWLNPYSRSLTH